MESINQSAASTIKPSGEVTTTNGAGYITLQAGGDVEVNGATITTGGDVVTASGVSLDNHPHSQGVDSGGDSQQPTDPPTATE